MRELKSTEHHKVTGGMSCLDHETWQNINQHAKKDGATFSIVTTPLVAAAALGLANAPIAAVAALVYAPWAAFAGYVNSPAWNIT
mgnify:CR=1 FL=1|tara:strand:+ start:13411 stop:13665 length:255 start_codon:yes stop_codon:yes gene_type:complete